MGLKDKVAYWCLGGWIWDAFFGWIDNENKKVNGKTKGKDPAVRTVKCKRTAFCEEMRNGPEGCMYCARERDGVPVACPDAINPS